jgi:T5orf172 domain-containing protein
MKIFATRVWGFDPWHWPVVVFGREGDLKSLLARSSPGDRIILAATLDEERVEPQNRGRLLGMAEFGRRIVRTEEIVRREHMAPHDLDETGRVKWPYALVITNAWTFPDLPGTVDVLGHQLPRNATSQAVLLGDDEALAIGRLRTAPVELPPVVVKYRAVVDVLRGGKPTTGPTPTSVSFSVERAADQPAFTYCLQFGKRDVWKIGHAIDPKQRLREVNTHVPSEVLGECWQIALTQGWDSSTDAFAMEQRVLKALHRFRTEGERVRCAWKEIDRAWQSGTLSSRSSGA